MTTRREILVGSLVLGGVAVAQPTVKSGSTRGDAFLGKHAPKPLPFDPKKLTGISEKLIVSHHDNNYAGAVKNLNKVEEALAQVTPDTPGFTVSGMEAAKLKFTNSMILHEMYFANLGGDGQSVGSATEKALVQAYGSRARWEELFRALGNSLGGGSGWAILGLGPPRAGRAHLLGWRPHQRAGLRRAAPGDGHVRARVCDGLRGFGEGLHRRVLQEHQLARGRPPRPHMGTRCVDPSSAAPRVQTCAKRCRRIARRRPHR